jgi:hypothetical protein
LRRRREAPEEARYPEAYPAFIGFRSAGEADKSAAPKTIAFQWGGFYGGRQKSFSCAKFATVYKSQIVAVCSTGAQLE